jgi:hypothetical protein
MVKAELDFNKWGFPQQSQVAELYPAEYSIIKNAKGKGRESMPNLVVPYPADVPEDIPNEVAHKHCRRTPVRPCMTCGIEASSSTHPTQKSEMAQRLESTQYPTLLRPQAYAITRNNEFLDVLFKHMQTNPPYNPSSEFQTSGEAPRPPVLRSRRPVLSYAGLLIVETALRRLTIEKEQEETIDWQNVKQDLNGENGFHKRSKDDAGDEQGEGPTEGDNR